MGALTKMIEEIERSTVDIRLAMEAMEEIRDLCGFYAKWKALERHGMDLSDGFFYEVFTEEEQQLLFELESRGYLTTGIVRLLG